MAAPSTSGPSPYSARIESDLIDPDDATLSLDEHDPLESAPLTSQAPSSSNPVPQGYLNQQIGGEDRRAPLNTLDESVWETLSRDLRASWLKMKLVLWPKHLLGGMLAREGVLSSIEAGRPDLRGLARLPGAEDILSGGVNESLRDWDLWGPLVFSLLLSLLLSFGRGKQTESIFTGVFSMVWIGSAIVTWQVGLLGGKIAFFQTICIIGYTLFPLVIAAIFSAVNLPWYIRLPFDLVLLAWSLAAGVSILGGSGVVHKRVALAVYPLFVFYVGLACLCFIS